MRMKWMLTTLLLTAMLALTGAQARGQAGAAAKDRPGVADGQMDVGVAGSWAFTSATAGTGTQQTPSNSYGGTAEVRYIVSPLLGAEFAVSYINAPQKYTPRAGNCALVCQNQAASISTKAIAPAFDYIASYKVGNLRPFLLGGIGLFVAIPGATPFGNNDSIRGAYNFGGGVDWNASAHLGIRLQFRDTYYKAPNVSSIYPATGQFTSSAQPMGGIFYRF